MRQMSKFLNQETRPLLCLIQGENSTYENIFTDEISEQVKVNNKFQKNYQRREIHTLETKNKEEVKPHMIQIRDLLSSLFEYGNGL